MVESIKSRGEEEASWPALRDRWIVIESKDPQASQAPGRYTHKKKAGRGEESTLAFRPSRQSHVISKQASTHRISEIEFFNTPTSSDTRRLITN
jgi:hypothetical protein